MIIRRAKVSDIDGINRLLRQVLDIHHNGRPDLFKSGAKKYTDEELAAIIGDDKSPIFVAVDDENLLGYAFCKLTEIKDNNILTDILSLYIDDICVDESARGRHIGAALYSYVLSFAKEQGCYNITLNVWSCNEAAMKFYEKCGLVPQKTVMEKIL